MITKRRFLAGLLCAAASLLAAAAPPTLTPQPFISGLASPVEIAHANDDLCPEIDTIFLHTRTEHGFVSASLVSEIARHVGDESRYAPHVVCSALKDKFAKGREP